MCELKFDEDLQTYLSPNVYRMLCETGILSSNIISLPGSTRDGMFVDGFLNWNALPSNLLTFADNECDYFRLVQDLAPVFFSVHQYYETVSEVDFEVKFLRFSVWTGHQPVILRCLHVLRNGSVTSTNHALLLLTAILEHALGDLIMLRTTQCPSLLRDLLEMPELKDLLSPAVVQLLSVVIGPPTSLNLRNIVWHGFPRPGELSIQYPYVILCVITSIGHLLANNGIVNIQHRDLLHINIPRVFPAFDIGQSVLDEINQLINNSHFVAPPMRPFWHTSLELYAEGQYGECFALLLPQLEMALRRVFVVANGCPARALTAENSVLFTTLDEILATTLPDGSENQCSNTIGSSYTTMLLDLLIYPMGPRARDHISHGEVHFDSVTFDAAHHFVCMCIAFASKFVIQNFKDRLPTCVKAICETANKYESLFHPISIVKQLILEASQSLCSWENIPRPAMGLFNLDTVLVQHSTSDQMPSLAACKAFRNFRRVLLDGSEISHKLLLEAQELSGDMQPVIQSTIEHIKLNTVYRYSNSNSVISKEEQVLRILMRILKLIVTISQQVLDIAGKRHKQWERKEMHSRQRGNYARFLGSISTISTTVRVIVLITLIVVCQLDDLQQNSQQQIALIKLFKCVQKYCENLLTYSSAAVNKWTEAVAVSDDLVQKLLAFTMPAVST